MPGADADERAADAQLVPAGGRGESFGMSFRRSFRRAFGVSGAHSAAIVSETERSMCAATVGFTRSNRTCAFNYSSWPESSLTRPLSILTCSQDRRRTG